MNWSTSWNDTPKLPQAQSDTPKLEAPKVNPKPSTFPEWDAKSQDDVLMEHQRMQTELARLKEEELSFRKYIVDRCFPQKHEGMNTLDLGNGYSLKAGVKFNYTLADNDTVEKTLDNIMKIGNSGAFIADRLVSWKPSFLLTEYRKLEDDAKGGSVEAKAILKEIENMLTINDEAAPTLEVKEPKAKKK